MDVCIEPHVLAGTIPAIPSKSIAHRLLILAALSETETKIELSHVSEDTIATIRCLTELGSSIIASESGFAIAPITRCNLASNARLDVGESGSTLRFLLPIVCALGCDAHISCRGRLAQRPLSPLDEQLVEHGAHVEWIDSSTLKTSGRLSAGQFLLPGNVSSQFVSGLLMAAPLLNQDVDIAVIKPVESSAYIDLTIDALDLFGVHVHEQDRTIEGNECHIYRVSAGVRLTSPNKAHVEGDWSNAAFWLAAGALGCGPIRISNLNLQSRQGDKAIMAALALFGAMVSRSGATASSRRLSLHATRIDVSGIPDLVPPLAAVASVAAGTTYLTNAGRLKLKESDRLQTVCDALNQLGGRARVVENDLVIEGVSTLDGGVVDAAHDHRIAMMAAICASSAKGPSVIKGAECVGKSYPAFFEDFKALGGSFI